MKKFLSLKTIETCSLSHAVLFVVFISILIEIFLISIGFFAISGDESDRSIQAFNWALGLDVYDASWLPLHRFIVGLGFKIFPDLFIAPRIISFIFGTAIIPLTTWLSFELFQSKKIAIFTALLSCFFFPRIIFTAVPLTESIFIAIIISGSASLVNWLRKDNLPQLYLAGILFLLGSSVRYEGWIFSVVFGILITYMFIMHKTKNKVLNYFILILVLASFPIYWLYYHSTASGDALGFIFSATDRYSLLHGSSIIRQLKNSLLPQFIFQNIVSLNILSAGALILVWKKDQRIKVFITFLFISFLIMALATILGKALPSHNFWRVPAVWSILLLPLSAYLIAELKKVFNKTTVSHKYLLLILFITCNLGMTTYEVNKRSSFTKAHYGVGKIANDILINANNSKILLETSSWGYLNILVSSQHPNNFIFNTGIDPKLPEASKINPELTIQELSANNIKFIAVKSDEYKNILKSFPFVKRYDAYEDWNIYKVTFN